MSLVCPPKIRQLVADLERVGFELVPGGKGSHRKFTLTLHKIEHVPSP